MKLLHTLIIENSILLLKSTHSNMLNIIDKHNALFLMDELTYKYSKCFKTSLTHNRNLSSCVDIAVDTTTLISTIPDSNEAIIIDIKSRSELYRLKHPDSKINCVNIHPDMRYYFTGGVDGEIYAWALNTGKFSFKISAHTNKVTVITSSDCACYLASGSHDLTINIFHINSIKQLVTLRGHKSPIVKIHFMTDNQLLSIDESGEIIVWDTLNAKIIKRISNIYGDVSSMTIDAKKNICVIGTKKGFISLYDLQSMKIISSFSIPKDEFITSILFMESPLRIAVGTIEGSLYIYSTQELFEFMTPHEKYHQINSTPIHFDAVIDTTQAESDILEKVYTYFDNNKINEAEYLLEKLKRITQNQSHINKILREGEHCEQFNRYCLERNFTIAYAIAEKHPEVKNPLKIPFNTRTFKKNTYT